MTTTARFIYRGTKLNQAPAKKTITQTFLDTRPGSPARARLDAILMARVNAAKVVTSKYYTATFKGLGEVLHNPQFQPFDNTSRPRKLHRMLTVPVRGVELTNRDLSGTQTSTRAAPGKPVQEYQRPRMEPISKTIIGRATYGSSATSGRAETASGAVDTRLPKRVTAGNRRTTRYTQATINFKEYKKIGKTLIKVSFRRKGGDMEPYYNYVHPRSTELRSSTPNKRVEQSLTGAAQGAKPLPSSKGPLLSSSSGQVPLTTSFAELSARHTARIPQAERVRLESGVGEHKAWKGLSPDYRRGTGFWKGYHESRSFWRKTGKLSQAYDAWLNRNIKRLSDPSHYSSPATERKLFVPNVKLTGNRPRLASISFSIQVPPLNMVTPGVLDAPFRLSFMRGKPLELLPPTVRSVVKKLVRVNGKRITVHADGRTQLTVRNVVGLNRMQSPEFSRPFVARYIAAMGQRYEATLKNVLKPR